MVESLHPIYPCTVLNELKIKSDFLEIYAFWGRNPFFRNNQISSNLWSDLVDAIGVLKAVDMD